MLVMSTEILYDILLLQQVEAKIIIPPKVMPFSQLITAKFLLESVPTHFQ